MRIGKQDEPYQSICASDATSITVRGHDLCGDIIGTLDFTSYFWLLVTGVRPTPPQRAMADAVLTAIAEHGLVPSVVSARMTLAAAPEALQGAVAAGLLGCGSVVLGSAEAAADFFTACLATNCVPAELPVAVHRAITDLRVQRLPVPGFGHPQHSDGDPRAKRLIALAHEHGVAGRHVGLLTTISDTLEAAIGRTLPVNVNGAIAAVMLDAGFPRNAMKGIALLARTAGLIAHLTEEREHSIGFILSGKAAEAITHIEAWT